MRAACVAIVLAAVGCRANPQYCVGKPNNSCESTVDGSMVDTPEIEIDAPFDGDLRYRPTAVRFEKAGGDYLSTAALNNTNNGSKGTYSVWLHFNAGDGTDQLLTGASVLGVGGGIIRTQQNRIRFLLLDCGAGTHVNMQTQSLVTTTSGWVHVMASWDTAANKGDIYINGSHDVMTGQSIASGDICYNAGKWGVGGLTSGTLDADVADLWADLDNALDLSVAANRAKFIDASGNPVDPGADCTGPTGASPTLCFHGNIATWNVNRGDGGGMDRMGDGLDASPTNPLH